jgi:hypothetical protein
MRKSYGIVLGVLLVAALALPALAKKGGGGGESQKGGLPALEDRVDALEARIVTLEGQNNWAVVSSAGAVVRSFPSTGVTATQIATGQYEVTFTQDVSGCAYVATIGDTAHAIPTQGQISVSGDVDSDNPNDVFVQTFDRLGLVATNLPFHLYVSCP